MVADSVGLRGAAVVGGGDLTSMVSAEDDDQLLAIGEQVSEQEGVSTSSIASVQATSVGSVLIDGIRVPLLLGRLGGEGFDSNAIIPFLYQLVLESESKNRDYKNRVEFSEVQSALDRVRADIGQTENKRAELDVLSRKKVEVEQEKEDASADLTANENLLRVAVQHRDRMQALYEADNTAVNQANLNEANEEVDNLRARVASGVGKVEAYEVQLSDIKERIRALSSEISGLFNKALQSVHDVIVKQCITRDLVDGVMVSGSVTDSNLDESLQAYQRFVNKQRKINKKLLWTAIDDGRPSAIPVNAAIIRADEQRKRLAAGEDVAKKEGRDEIERVAEDPVDLGKALCLAMSLLYSDIKDQFSGAVGLGSDQAVGEKALEVEGRRRLRVQG